MNYKEIIRIKFPNKHPIRYVDDTYAGIIWNPLDTSPNPSKTELDQAMLEVAPIIGDGAQTLGVTNVNGDTSDFIVTIPSTIFVNSFTYAVVGPTIGTAVLPLDSSIPSITEGSRLAAITITPKSTSSKFKCSFSGMVDCGTNNKSIVFAVFRGNVCVGATAGDLATSGKPTNVTIEVVDVPNTSLAVTYSLRVGVSSSGTWYVNTTSNGASLGGSASSTFKVTEFE